MLKAIISVMAGAALLAGPLGVALAQTGSGYDLTWHTIDGGGTTTATGGAYSLSGSIGQPDAGSQTGGGYVLRGGFWTAPDHLRQVYLPLVKRNM